jgi:integrase
VALEGTTLEAATAALVRLLGEGGRFPGATVGDVVRAFLARQDERHAAGEIADSTRTMYGRMLAQLGELGKAEVAAAGAIHAERWLLARPPGARNERASILRQAIRWARDEGLIADSPLLRWRRRGSVRPRRRLMTDEDVAGLLAWIAPAARPVVEFVRDHGCRPGEACAIEARHVAGDVVTLDRHKTAGRGGVRRIYLTRDWPARLAGLAAEVGGGPLFRCRDGRPWNVDRLNQAVIAARRRGGLPGHVRVGSLRHRWITRALLAGEPVAVVAELAGHTKPTYTVTRYNLTADAHDRLRDAARRLGA